MFNICKKSFTLARGKIGVISDTHGLLRPEALAALKGSELIIHAGDIGKPEILLKLAEVAPVMAIRGNNDRNEWAYEIPDILQLRINGVNLQVIHNVHDLDEDSAPHGIRAMISGHSHKPSMTTADNVLYLNPGSAGPRRFKLPVAVARLRILRRDIRGDIVELPVNSTQK